MDLLQNVLKVHRHPFQLFSAFFQVFLVFFEFNCFQVLISRDRPLVASYHLTILPSHGQKCHRSHLTILPSYHLTARSTAGLQLPILPSYHLTKMSMCLSHLTILPSYHLTKMSTCFSHLTILPSDEAEWAGVPSYHLTLLPTYGADAKYTLKNQNAPWTNKTKHTLNNETYPKRPQWNIP